jgi:hypothetical protein
MSRLLSSVAVAFLLLGGLAVMPAALMAAADKEPVNTAWMEAGKADAKASFAKQAGSAPKAAAWPTIIGEYLWSGRADDKYKPFFMFELRVRGATKTTEATKYRIVTLDPARKAQTSGPWMDLGKVNPGETRELSYKLNCPTFQAFQVEITWKDGAKNVQETYLAWDKVAMLPVALSEVANVPFLICLNQNFEHDETKKLAAVSYMLWNIGGKPAKDVQQTILFKDGAGKTVHSHEIKPARPEVAGGFVGEVKLSVPKVPSFANLAIATKMTDITTLDPGSFTGAEEVEIAQVRAEGKVLKAKVRNGLKTPLSGVVVVITLTDGNGKAVKALNLPVGELKAGEERDLSTDISTVGVWSGYEVGWKSSEPPAPTGTTASAPKSPATPALLVDGLEFTVTSTRPDKDGLAVSGILRNKRDADLDGLVVSFTLPNGSKDGAVVTLKPGKLVMGEDGVAVNFTATGVKAFTGLSLKWVSKKQ